MSLGNTKYSTEHPFIFSAKSKYFSCTVKVFSVWKKALDSTKCLFFISLFNFFYFLYKMKMVDFCFSLAEYFVEAFVEWIKSSIC